MNSILKYRGRHVTAEEVGFIKELISKDPAIGRCELSRQICKEWNWVRSNGQWSSSGHGMPGFDVRIRKKRLYCTSSPKVYADKPIFEAKSPEKNRTGSKSNKDGSKRNSAHQSLLLSRYDGLPWKNYLIALFVIIIILAILNRWENISSTWYFQILSKLSKGRLPVLPGHQQYAILAVEIVLLAGTKKHEKRIFTCLPITPVF